MSTSDNTGVIPTGKSSEAVDDIKNELSRVSMAGSDAAKEVAESRFEQGRDATTNQLDTASDAMSEAAAKLEESDSPFASYASELSEQLSSFSGKISTSSIDDLVGGARSLARDNPAAFMLGSMAIGLAASRFFKATGEQVVRHSGASGSHSGLSYGEHTSHAGGRHASRAENGTPDFHPDNESLRVRAAVTGGADTPDPSGNSPVIDRGNTGSASEQEKLIDHHDRINREEA